MLDGDLGSSQAHALFPSNFPFYLESHWQLNNVEVNVVQLQDLQGFLQRGTHQLWGVAGVPQLGRQAQSFFGCQEEQWASWIPATHTPSLLSFWQSPLCTVQRHRGLHPCKAEVRALPCLLSEPGAEVKTGIRAQDWMQCWPSKAITYFFITTEVLLSWVYCKLLLNELRFLLFSKHMLSLKNFVPTRSLWSVLCLKAEAWIIWVSYWTANHPAQRKSGFLLGSWSLRDCLT